MRASAGAATVPPVTAADAHLATAEQLLAGAHVLAAAPNCAVAFAFVCAHSAECIFKAFLLRRGVAEKDLRNDGLRHDLLALRTLAIANGLPAEPTPPRWLQLLRDLHNKPYQLRYPIGLHGLVLPAAQPTLDDLEKLEELARPARP